MISLHDISVYYNKSETNEICALDTINLNISAGDFVTVIGSNGAGKTTLLNVIAGSVAQSSGELLLDGIDISGSREYQRAQYIGRIFQDPRAGSAENMTLEENMSICYRKGKMGLRISLGSKLRDYFAEELTKLDMGLEDRMKIPVGQLSGGQRQALTLLMTVMSQPRLMLLDEHTAALDPSNAHRILELTNKFIREYSLTTLMITHNMNHAIHYGNRLLMMDKGEIIADIGEEQKKDLTVAQLLSFFEQSRHRQLDDDRLLLSTL